MLESVAAIIFANLTVIVILFQGCLALGMPYGEASMGGKYPGTYPLKMRVVAVMNMLLLSFTAALILAKADMLFPQLKSASVIGVWFIVVFFGIGTVLNSITPSKIERMWAPVALVQLITSFIVAIS
ncbi:hypothetical protein SYJ56_25470 [Algoriphagus sp. D3-2-R+10]|uniref:hypothetical protein n=1 Tax=Algoriphagus aurantiacus TaxID=3103948 RepID=UPI002B3B6A3B|nr:hypothetical protein [Algoriphagus sp. D3-2-R+10]MEB2778683.1 hypothetical protein [Algoriphagus sp. D3-2-R+10]